MKTSRRTVSTVHTVAYPPRILANLCFIFRCVRTTSIHCHFVLFLPAAQSPTFPDGLRVDGDATCRRGGYLRGLFACVRPTVQRMFAQMQKYIQHETRRLPTPLRGLYTCVCVTFVVTIDINYLQTSVYGIVVCAKSNYEMNKLTEISN